MEINASLLVGLAIGLIGVIIVWLGGLGKRRSLSKELKELKKHLNNQMEINAKGTETQKKEMEKLKKKNENLQATLATFKAKTSTEEKRMLLIYDKAIHLMYEKAPGFATTWEIIIKEAKDELDMADDGSEKLTKKIIRPSLFSKAKSLLTNQDNNE